MRDEKEMSQGEADETRRTVLDDVRTGSSAASSSHAEYKLARYGSADAQSEHAQLHRGRQRDGLAPFLRCTSPAAVVTSAAAITAVGMGERECQLIVPQMGQ
jgi:hypothetical protein